MFKIFKYLFILFSLFISNQIYAGCEPNIYGAFSSNLADPPYTICAHHKDFGSNKCVMLVDNMQKKADGWTLFAQTTGATCNEVTKLNEEPEQYDCKSDSCPVTDDQACPAGYRKGMYNGTLSCVKDQNKETLQCNLDYCLNPQGKLCPTGYRKGTFNGQSVCSKKINPDNPDEPDDEGEDKGSIVEAVNNAENSITGSIFNLGKSISDSINEFWNNLKQYLDEKSSNDGNDNGGDGNGGNGGDGNGGNGDEDGSGLDLTGLEAEVPIAQLPAPSQQLNRNIFNYNQSCPPDNTLSLNFLGKSFSYTFKYQNFCDGLAILGFFILTIAYALGAHIVVKA